MVGGSRWTTFRYLGNRQVGGKALGAVDPRSDFDDSLRHVRIMPVPKSMFEDLPASGDRLELYELISSETVGRGRLPTKFLRGKHPASFCISIFSNRTKMASGWLT